MEELHLPINRQRFLACFSTAGLGSTLLPGALAAIAQDTEVVTIEMLEAAEQIAGIAFSRDEQERILGRLNGARSPLPAFDILRAAELGNDTQPAIVFNPVPPGKVLPTERRPLRRSEIEVPVPATICGAFEKGEDIDYYKFKAEAGMAISFHVRCMRLQDRIHDLQNHADPMITLRNTSGTTLAAVDNYFAADPWLTYQFKEAGEYYLEIRDVRFNGNAYWQYSLEISDRPFISNVYPLGVKRGEEIDFGDDAAVEGDDVDERRSRYCNPGLALKS